MGKNIEVSTGPRKTFLAVPSSTRGIPGPKGDPGMLVVNHGGDPTVARPVTEGVVLWKGSVQPENWDEALDLWLKLESE